MSITTVDEKFKADFNSNVEHVICSWQWGIFRQKEGKKVLRIAKFQNNKLTDGFQLTFHPVPFFNTSIGFLPKSNLPDVETLNFLTKIGKENNAAFIRIEPNIESAKVNAPFKKFLNYPKIKKSTKSIFAENTFILDLTKSEDQLLADMHPKTRYNINLARKQGVVVEEKDDQKSFEIFLKLQRQTAQRQKFFIHPDNYYRLLWKVLRPENMIHLLIASFKKQPLTAWILFRFKDTLYYPYGGSSEIYKNLMSSNLIAWEAIILGKKLGCRQFDFWGALGPDADSRDPWYGFHRFKQGYGGKLVSYIGTYDFVINHVQYKLISTINKIRWTILRAVNR
jgi:lipid II:glycine glycyltransferase (peptidoglycan interpeptide bridge formation enzyme)